jgi:hypothetical protein
VIKLLFGSLVIFVALCLVVYESAYFKNRQAYQIHTAGRTIDKIDVDDCNEGPVTGGDPAFDRDYNQALEATCTPWLRTHYFKLWAILLGTAGITLVIVIFPRLELARRTAER